MLKIRTERISKIQVLKRSIDARQKKVKIQLRAKVFWDENPPAEKEFKPGFKKVHQQKELYIVGAGPAGLFAALELLRIGIKPIILERGKPVQKRRKDVADLNRNKSLNENSNYAFGEGGAGTFSDGKLYTRSKKRGKINDILNLLKYFGAAEDILTDAHPHIGTDVLPRVIVRARKTILEFGGEIHFEHRLNDIKVHNGEITGIQTQNGKTFNTDTLLLAVGHSARDIYRLLHKKNIRLEAKSFAMGVRVEHPQSLIDSAQYHCTVRSDYLPPAEYRQAVQINGRGVYSFCMCPGGFIVPATSENGRIVVNGMSPSGRNSKFANSGIVVEIKPEDFPEKEKYGALAGLYMQDELEKLAFKHGEPVAKAPAQGLLDFVNGKRSEILPECSYHPGLVPSALHEWLPEHIGTRLRIAFKEFDTKMHGYLTNEALILGVESRTSSPVRIPRDRMSLQHPEIKGLYPCGEGAGYAGGIVSAGMDGQKCARAAADYIKE